MRFVILLLPLFSADTPPLSGANGQAPSAPQSLSGTATAPALSTSALLTVTSGAVDFSNANQIVLAPEDLVTVIATANSNDVVALCPSGYSIVAGSCGSLQGANNYLNISCPAVCLDTSDCVDDGACLLSGNEAVGDSFTAGAVSGTIAAIGWRCTAVSFGGTDVASVTCLRQ